MSWKYESTRVMALCHYPFFFPKHSPVKKHYIMIVKINGKPTDTSASNLAELAGELSLPNAGVAMALNSKMVQRSDWADTPSSEDAEIIIIKAACGG